MALGSELVMIVGLGFVVLGPKRMHSVLGQVARMRSELEKASCAVRTQLTAELDTREGEDQTSVAATLREPATRSDLQKDPSPPQQPQQEPAE
jgi:Sec-independent protein translocase protein TatA